MEPESERESRRPFLSLGWRSRALVKALGTQDTIRLSPEQKQLLDLQTKDYSSITLSSATEESVVRVNRAAQECTKGYLEKPA